MTINFKNKTKSNFIECNDFFKNKSNPSFNKGLLSKRKFKLITDLFALISFKAFNQHIFNLVSELILLVLNTPENFFLDKSFFESNSNNEEKTCFRSIPNLIKRITVIVNSIRLSDKRKIKYLEFVRSLIKMYTKGITCN